MMRSHENMQITDEFNHAVNVIEHSQKHVFITGNAGTGKSTLLQYMRQMTKKTHVVVTPTGLSAVHVGGQTVHSFFHLSHNTNPEKAREIGKKRKKDKTLLQLELLFIDEISMVRCDLLDAVDIILKTVRDSALPFGGVQVVCIGDVLQLPPVITPEEHDMMLRNYETIYFFSSQVFQQILRYGKDNFQYIHLTHPFRQQNDRVYSSVLDSIRVNQLPSDALTLLNAKYDESWIEKTNSHIVVTTTNKKAQTINHTHLNTIEDEELVYSAVIEGDFDIKCAPNDTQLVLKRGARVMCIKNDPKKKYYNGSLGTITHLNSRSVEVELDSGNSVVLEAAEWNTTKFIYNEKKKHMESEIIGSYLQIPLKLAWAITIHKSQGQTFETMILDLDRGAFASGQTYVALSRCRALDGLILARPIRERDIHCDTTVFRFLQDMQDYGYRFNK